MSQINAHAPCFDVAVIGAGPGGAVAATWLARGGANVALIEKEALPRYKTCGGGLVRRAFQHLPPDVEVPVQDACSVVEMHIARGGSFRVERTEPIVVMTMRSELDLALAQAAVRAGVVLRSPCELRGLAQDARGVDLDTSTGALRAAFVIAADGALGPTARLAGWTEAVEAVAALEAEVTIDADELARFRGAARFDLGTPEAGYGWVFPKRAQLSAGVLTMRRKRGGLRAALRGYLDGLGLRSLAIEEHGFVIPIRPRRGGFVRGRVLLTGDAAGLADPVTGEGISWAGQSGAFAAKALLDARFDVRRSGAAYTRRLAREILPELRVARALASLLYRRPALRRRLFERSGQALCEAMTDVVCGARTYRELVYSPRSYVTLLRAQVAAPG